jgi:hypothetical protein
MYDSAKTAPWDIHSFRHTHKKTLWRQTGFCFSALNLVPSPCCLQIVDFSNAYRFMKKVDFFNP